MRRGVIFVMMIVVLSVSAGAAPQDSVDRERGRRRGVIHVVKTILRTLGDGLIIPIP